MGVFHAAAIDPHSSQSDHRISPMILAAAAVCLVWYIAVAGVCVVGYAQM